MKTRFPILSALLLPAALLYLALAGPLQAAEYPVDGNPSLSDKALWGRKSGTTNTKEDVEVTSGAIHVFSEGGTATTPPTGASATQVQGTAADAAAAVGNPVQIGGVDGSGNTQRVLTDTTGAVATYSVAPAAADILAGAASVTATTASTALITITANRSWVGKVCVSVAGSKAATATANGEVLGTILTAGTNVTPAAGTYFEVDAAIGANAATGAVGTQDSNQGCQDLSVVAPAGNTVTVNYSATCTNTTACRVSASASGRMF